MKRRAGSAIFEGPCPKCHGRGWRDRGTNEWPEACELCVGHGNVTRAELGRFLAGPDAKWNVVERWQTRVRRADKRGVLSATLAANLFRAFERRLPEVFAACSLCELRAYEPIQPTLENLDAARDEEERQCALVDMRPPASHAIGFHAEEP